MTYENVATDNLSETQTMTIHSEYKSRIVCKSLLFK
jgi:hypothetical protein